MPYRSGEPWPPLGQPDLGLQSIPAAITGAPALRPQRHRRLRPDGGGVRRRQDQIRHGRLFPHEPEGRRCHRPRTDGGGHDHACGQRHRPAPPPCREAAARDRLAPRCWPMRCCASCTLSRYSASSMPMPAPSAIAAASPPSRRCRPGPSAPRTEHHAQRQHRHHHRASCGEGDEQRRGATTACASAAATSASRPCARRCFVASMPADPHEQDCPLGCSTSGLSWPGPRVQRLGAVVAGRLAVAGVLGRGVRRSG